MKALLDYIPIIVFFYLYKTTDKDNPAHPLLTAIGLTGGESNNHIIVATAGLTLATLVIYGFLFVSQKFRLQKQQIFVLLMTVVFGGLTLALRDDFYIRLKAVLINLGFALALFLSPFFLSNKESAIQKLLSPVFELSSSAWQKLNLVWAGFFVLMASLHAFFAFVFMGGEYWGEFTAFGDIIVMISFMVGMFIVLRKHIKIDETAVKK
ncbi:inner membrane-spanning protein YciB [Moraxella bovis]|uniref:Inner membrane-spanning protein YciB n=1 Tax=Moraxella bovis TaxID=476 RepID=A0A378Q1P1_MORBO|nr:septation protein IspZ [Moraxella bovis]UYZ67839.1 septation protein IspZ [Moraxella bovis]UYZ70214.1 septation protein IspZ [Moraxella bovis]UYZ73877.1 septation protein IspZ [Moraxella bovis]UZA13512.1 septation protein IspZ [Moraxella bovis]UZA28132.1 septation protein IspZ [Moraxella bovis]